MSGFKPFAEDWPRGPGTNRVDWQGEIQQGDRLTELDTLADSADYALPGVVRSALRDAAAMIRNLRRQRDEARADVARTTDSFGEALSQARARIAELEGQLKCCYENANERIAELEREAELERGQAGGETR